jgi:hypothetical protein
MKIAAMRKQPQAVKNIPWLVLSVVCFGFARAIIETRRIISLSFSWLQMVRMPFKPGY